MNFSKEAPAVNKDQARKVLENELRIRPTVRASAIFTGKHGSIYSL